MSYVRLDDSVMDNPKMLTLSDRAFRGWIWGLCYAQRHLTDGYLPLAALTAPVKRAAGELQSRGLWDVVEHGFQIHNYLKHQDSKDVVEDRKQRARDRMRDRRSCSERRDPLRAPSVRANISETFREASLPSLSSYGSSGKEGCGEEGDALGDRARRLLEDLYPAWYAKFRHGAKLRLVMNTLTVGDALTVVKLWDDKRIEQLAQIFLTTDESWIASTDRNFRIFASRASWCDDRLKQAELKVQA